MNFKNSYKILVMLITIVMSTMSCSSNSESEAPMLSISETEVFFEPEGGTLEITVSANDTWKITNSTAWLQLNPTMGNAGEGVIALTVVINETGVTRSVILDVTSDNGQARRITVSQGAHLYPSYNVTPLAPDATGMGSNAVELASKMKLGWNIGNTFEAPGGETGWGNPVITEDFIKFVKQQGFNTIRIPCAWDWHHVVDPTTARIDPDWLNRVKEVVGYCVDNDVYVLLNIHWDGGWLDENINKAKQEITNAKQKAYWEQIATAMRDFDDHLLFAGSNEPPADDAEEMEVLLSYHQTFVDAVRSTGGRNSYRTLVVQGPSTDIDKTDNLMNTLPIDELQGRMMVEVHYYTPFQFCLMNGDASWGSMFYYWGEDNHSTIESGRNATWGEENAVDEYFGKMKTKFVDKGFPVIMGEYGAYRRDNSQNVPQDLEAHNNSVDHWITYVTKQALANGMIPYWWDTGGALDRSNNTVKDQRTIDALIIAVAN